MFAAIRNNRYHVSGMRRLVMYYPIEKKTFAKRSRVNIEKLWLIINIYFAFGSAQVVTWFLSFHKVPFLDDICFPDKWNDSYYASDKEIGFVSRPFYTCIDL